MALAEDGFISTSRTVRFPAVISGPCVAPHDLAYPDCDKQYAPERPFDLSGHEAVQEGDVQPLQYPDTAARNHQQAQQAVDTAHDSIENIAHRFPRSFHAADARKCMATPFMQ